jgi:hypothetical protein
VQRFLKKQAAVRLAPRHDCCSRKCNSYRYRIVKEQPLRRLTPSGSPVAPAPAGPPASTATNSVRYGQIRQGFTEFRLGRRRCTRAKCNGSHPGYPSSTDFTDFLCLACGDDRDRTGNLRLAKPALSQLSYVPVSCSWLAAKLGVLGFEPRTSALSELRSSQLSYTPSRSVSGRQKQKSQTDAGLALSDFRLWDRAWSPLLDDGTNHGNHERSDLLGRGHPYT